MKILLLQLASALLYGAAGCAVCVMLFSRGSMLMRYGGLKTRLSGAAYILIASGLFIIGFFAYSPPWIFIPGAVLAFILVGETRMIFSRRANVASSPIDSIPHQVPLMNPITTTDLMAHRYKVFHPKWSGKPFRIVQITDLHVHTDLPLEYYREAIGIAARAKPDLAIFTGDFITKFSSLPKLKLVLRPVARVANLAVLGNHDYWVNPEAIRAAVQESGLRLLSNETITLNIDGRCVAVTGYDYPWGTNEKSVPARSDGLLHLVLSHTPDNIYRVAGSSANIMFSGHYHAGQIRLPVLGSIIIPSVYGRRFDHGHFIVNGTHLFVASGVGAVHFPVRIYCQPDIFVVDIFPEKRES
jgi:predicted MPP superfamily phosphohydrolase